MRNANGSAKSSKIFGPLANKDLSTKDWKALKHRFFRMDCESLGSHIFLPPKLLKALNALKWRHQQGRKYEQLVHPIGKTSPFFRMSYTKIKSILGRVLKKLQHLPPMVTPTEVCALWSFSRNAPGCCIINFIHFTWLID